LIDQETSMGSERKIRVLIVDDSSVVRTMLQKLLTTDPAIEVVGTAPDPFVARDKVVALKPDVLTLDVEMPRMDGISFLEKLMEHMPIPTVIISSLTQKGSETAMRALEAGAVNVVTKPALDVSAGLTSMASEIVIAVKAASRANVQAMRRVPKAAQSGVIKSAALAKTTHQILAIAASTGGTEALKYLLSQMPAAIPGTVIVQHMPPLFTKSFADSLNKVAPFEVREAKEGDLVSPGLALLAPGNYHMELRRRGAQYFVHLQQAPLLHGVRPAADILFDSVAEHVGGNAVGVILTGMGRDGAAGLKKMREVGSYNFAQDEASCVVFGMPKEAIALGAIDEVKSLDRMAPAIAAQLVKREVV
jgi:two-component system chemotaxis response regulator CheB